MTKKSETFKKANIFKKLYAMVNDKNYLKNKENKLGWEYLEHFFDKKTHYKAIVLKKYYEIAIFNIGTDFKSIKDIGANLKMLFKGVTAQMKKANDYYHKIKEAFPECKIYLIGHSEGGSECQYVAGLNPELEVYTFNAYGIGNYPEIKNSQDCNVNNFRNKYDVVSKVSKPFGCMYVVSSKSQKFLPLILGFKFAHQIENLGDID